MVSALANPQVQINNITWSIVPNSLSIISGFGGTKVRAASTGNGGVETVHTVDAESQIGQIKFSVYPRPDQIDLLSEIKGNPGANVVSISENTDNGVFTRTLSVASLTNDPEIELSAEGEFELEFMGNPMQRGG